MRFVVVEAVTVFRHNDEWAIEEWLVLRTVNALGIHSHIAGLQIGTAIRICIFKSEARLRAFAGAPDVSKLPRQHGPSTALPGPDPSRLMAELRATKNGP